MKKQSLRITSGKLKNRKIYCDNHIDLRPTTGKIRQAVFDSLGNDLTNKNFLDLCSGSGINGYEALSRNASNVFFVEKNKRLKKDYLNNINSLNVDENNIKTYFEDALIFLNKTSEIFDLIYFDPPFQKQYQNNIKSLLYYNVLDLIFEKKLLNQQHGILIIEYFSKYRINFDLKRYKLLSKKKYGTIEIAYLSLT